MKQLSLAACIMCALVACNTATNSSNTSDTAVTADTMASDQNVSYAYPIGYTSDFTIGDSKYAQLVTELWKDYDDNAFERHADSFADSVSMDLSDGTSFMNSPKDSVIANVKRYRSSLKNAVSSVEVLTTLKPKGKDETWVCIWGKEVDTHNNGKLDSVFLNENWEFNKDGKAIYMAQYQAKPPAKK